MDAARSHERPDRKCDLCSLLDDAEVGRLAVIWDAARDSTVHSVLKDTCRALPDIGGRGRRPSPAGSTLFSRCDSFSNFAREKELGIWEERTEAQRTGTIFAETCGHDDIR